MPVLSFLPALARLDCAKFGAISCQGALCGVIAGQLSLWIILLSRVVVVHL